MTKMPDNGNLNTAFVNRICATPLTVLFMLHVSKYKNATFISTSTALTVNDASTSHYEKEVM